MDNEERGRRKDEEEEDSAPSKAGLMRARLGVVGHYALLGLAPLVSVVALIFAVMAYTGNQSNRARLDEANSRIDSISAAQSEPKGEMDIFQVSLAREKVLLAEERKKQAEKDARIISNVTHLQVKLKVSPTLEEQLRDDGKVPIAASAAVSAPVVASSGVSAASAPVSGAVPIPPRIEKKPVAQPIAKPAAKPAVSAKKPAPVVKGTNKQPVAAPTGADKAAKARALQKSIEEYNKSSKK